MQHIDTNPLLLALGIVSVASSSLTQSTKSRVFYTALLYLTGLTKRFDNLCQNREFFVDTFHV